MSTLAAASLSLYLNPAGGIVQRGGLELAARSHNTSSCLDQSLDKSSHYLIPIVLLGRIQPLFSVRLKWNGTTEGSISQFFYIVALRKPPASKKLFPKD
jgi:hypothetical protein